ncbi:phage tail protein [Adlercreutzia mucosicola]|uniref:Phage tail protein n=1 Tax=Adlercreutzia mucosicola TaxID=580026 RepID=A0A6N8JK79_9ACTN|nr:phage tail protein [Adlercreutzia mucosicola]MEB1814228.1 phage tail protein [Adlercreutzia mucosicola]MVX60042.1 phage tail protein [Adlercreutzia mucosicola]
MAVHTVHEVDCNVRTLPSEVVGAFLSEPLYDDAAILEEHVAFMADEVCSSLDPRGVYKLFNPSICTLPPKYVEPAIKLVGTLAVLHGQAVYERMSEAVHTAMVVSSLGSNEAIAALRERLVVTPEDAAVFQACLEALSATVADRLYEAVRADAHERGYHTDLTLETGAEDFPLAMNKTLVFFTEAEKRLGITAAEDGQVNTEWCTLGVVGLYDSTRKKRRGCAYCHNLKTCTIRKVGMTCHGRRTKAKMRAVAGPARQS